MNPNQTAYVRSIVGSFVVRLVLVMAGAHLQAGEGRAHVVTVSAADAGCLLVHIEEGVVTFVDDASGSTAYGGHTHEARLNAVVNYGPLAVMSATTAGNWILRGPGAYAAGLSPTVVHRKTKVNGMAQQEWSQTWDFNYGYTLEHHLYLRLPQPLTQGASYTLEIASGVNVDRTSSHVVFDIFQNRSEAVKVNLVGYESSPAVKAADLYLWMGDGGARDYSTWAGKRVYLYNVGTGSVSEVGAVAWWRPEGGDVWGRPLTRSPVWTADFTGFDAPGTYRLAVEDVGCSQDFEIKAGVYRDPFMVSTRGFFYMRIGQDGMSMTPVPRRPLYTPAQDPPGFTVVKTTMHPWHAEWAGSGDRWDQPEFFKLYVQSGSPVNPNAWGGHSDALDWDRHLGHISIIHDLLLPYLLSNGRIGDDDLGIAESGNGIPDVIDEARYEVDFWLRLRDGAGYAHGLSNELDNVMYQAAATPLAAWAASANAAMLADALRIAERPSEQAIYRDAAIAAYSYANSLADPWLDITLEAGNATYRSRDLKMTAAAFLYNLTGSSAWESVINAESVANTTTSVVAQSGAYNQHYATCAYLTTPQPVSFPVLRDRMRASIIHQGLQEANQRLTRPSRRGTVNNDGYFHTIQNMHNTIIAHAVTNDATVRASLLDALTLEADWGLGRNPLNMIQMTTATTPLAGKRSVQAMYTSGRNDGTPGLHPGHTPYLNMDDWDSGMVMGRPSGIADRGYPVQAQWPSAELSFNTRYVWAHAEFTPQQTMRGKQALYGYLYAIRSVLGDADGDGDVSTADLTLVRSQFGRSGSAIAPASADLDRNGRVDAIDLGLVTRMLTP